MKYYILKCYKGRVEETYEREEPLKDVRKEVDWLRKHYADGIKTDFIVKDENGNVI